MNKLKILSIILFVSAIVCFAIAGYVYKTYLGVFSELAYYNLEPEAYSNPTIIELLAKLKFGIIKFTVLGVIGTILGLFFLLKKFKSYEQENHQRH